jgi:hypothetical protein
LQLAVHLFRNDVGSLSAKISLEEWYQVPNSFKCFRCCWYHSCRKTNTGLSNWHLTTIVSLSCVLYTSNVFSNRGSTPHVRGSDKQSPLHVRVCFCKSGDSVVCTDPCCVCILPA